MTLSAAMAPPTVPKTKVYSHRPPMRLSTHRKQTQHLERVRKNQQRSRQRKRAYVARLEQELAQLTGRDEPVSTNSVPDKDDCLNQASVSARLQNENDARRDLLLALGVTVPAQERFIRTFITRSRPGETASPDAARLPTHDIHPRMSSSGGRSVGCPIHLAERCHSYRPSLSSQSDRPAHLATELSSASSFLGKCPVARLLVPLLSSEAVSVGGYAAVTSPRPPTIMSPKNDIQPAQSSRPYATSNTLKGPLGIPPTRLPYTPSPTVPPFFAPSQTDGEPSLRQLRPFDPTTDSLTLFDSDATQSNVIHGDNYTSHYTTACRIAASLIISNNAIGYSAQQLESRLQVGYRVTGIANEDCRILNRVLFAVLAEISWVP